MTQSSNESQEQRVLQYAGAMAHAHALLWVYSVSPSVLSRYLSTSPFLPPFSPYLSFSLKNKHFSLSLFFFTDSHNNSLNDSLEQTHAHTHTHTHTQTPTLSHPWAVSIMPSRCCILHPYPTWNCPPLRALMVPRRPLRGEGVSRPFKLLQSVEKGPFSAFLSPKPALICPSLPSSARV